MTAPASVVASLLALSVATVGNVSGAAPRDAPARPHARRDDPGRVYQRQIEVKLRAGRARIVAALGRARLRPARLQYLLQQVDWGMQTIRTRVANYAADHVITAAEAADVQAVAAAIAGEMDKKHGSIAPWNLLA